MTKFAILTGKALKSAIASRGKQIASFTEREHQLAVSALAHVAEHNDVCYVQALYDMTPANYRPGLRKWFMEFGKVGFDAKALKFTYVKTKVFNIEGAIEVAPANFEKAVREKSGEQSAFDQVKFLTRALAVLQDKGTPEVVKAVQGALRLAEKAAKTPTLTVVEGGKADETAAEAAPAKAPRAPKAKKVA